MRTWVSPHLRLEWAQIKRELLAAFTPELGDQFRVVPAAQCVDQLDPATRLAVAGHTVLDADACRRSGWTSSGVAAELLGRGVLARVVVEATLSTPIRVAVLEWAETAVAQFVERSGDELLDAGWQQLTSTRWQLLAVQPG